MRVTKEKLKVNIFLNDNLMVNGHVHINPGERLRDFINDSDEVFIAVTDAEVSYINQNRLESHTASSQGDLILNKSSIMWIKEA